MNIRINDMFVQGLRMLEKYLNIQFFVCLGCLVWVAEMAWDVFSGVAEMAWDVLFRLQIFVECFVP